MILKFILAIALTATSTTTFLPSRMAKAMSNPTGPSAEHAQEAKNPILWADMPDIAIIRVGDAYYMSSTTMHMSPGLPIMKSTDLVNWRLVSYAYNTLGLVRYKPSDEGDR